MQVYTINVLILNETGVPESTTPFLSNEGKDSDSATQTAEKMFKKIVQKLASEKHESISEEEMDDYLDEGNYNNRVFLMHATDPSLLSLEEMEEFSND